MTPQDMDTIRSIVHSFPSREHGDYVEKYEDQAVFFRKDSTPFLRMPWYDFETLKKYGVEK